METTSGIEIALSVGGSVLGFLVFFCTLFFGIFYLFSRLGWADLAEAYRSDTPFLGEQFITLLYIGHVKYGSQVRIGAGPQGLHLSCIFLQRWFPPLLFPWTDVTVSRKWAIVGSNYEFRFRARPSVPLTIHEQTALKLAAAAGSAWPGEPAAIGD
ncbi:MAG: hypothetical protein ACRD2M_03620 [Terriglobales bacterium]